MTPASSRGSSRISSQRSSCWRREMALVMFEQIAQAAYGAYARTGAFQFLAQAMNVDFDGVVADVLVPAAQRGQDLLLGHHLVLAQQEDFKHAELPGRQLQRPFC